MINRAAAETAIKNIFAQYKNQTSTASSGLMRALSDGKLYELFVLAEVVNDLTNRGCTVQFHGASLKFKAGPGKLKTSDPHFQVTTPHQHLLWLFVDIEFETLGNKLQSASDFSRRHELDIALVDKNAGYPNFDNLWLAVECKAVANFTKDIIKEALGVRRELSFLHGLQKSLLAACGTSPTNDVAADPPSEFWLAYIDPKGSQYAQSPAAFGIELRHMTP